jgi:DNA repair protein RecO (recombination protein O)
MQRSFSSSALVLRVRPSGESNREISFLSAEEGIIGATLFGGPKSRLRSHVSPFHSGTLWIYRDPAKGFAKVSDFDVDSWRPGLRELYERSEAASMIAGTILAGLGGGGAWPEALELALSALNALESAGEDFCGRIVLQFLWRWAGFLGNRPPLGGCSFCGTPVDPAGSDRLLWFIRGEGLLCGACALAAGPGRAALAVGPGARRWLSAVEKRPPLETARLGLDAASRAEVTAFTAALLET